MSHAHTTKKMLHVHMCNDNKKEKEHSAKHMLKVCKKLKIKQNSECAHQEENAEVAHKFQIRHKIKG